MNGFVVGNGPSRAGVDIAALKALYRFGTWIGCNGAYRESWPDHVVALDLEMLNEILAAGYEKDHSVWSWSGIPDGARVNKLDRDCLWSGTAALWLAITLRLDPIEIIGMDRTGPGGPEGEEARKIIRMTARRFTVEDDGRTRVERL
jgi:hypothetical protein